MVIRSRPAHSLEKREFGRGDISFDRDELGAPSSTDTDFTVANGLVSHGVLTDIVADHVGLDLDSVPVLAGVDFTDGADHLWHNNCVTQMGLDGLRLLTIGRVLHCLRELLDEAVVARVDSTSESAALAGAKHLDDLGSALFHERFELNTSVNLLFEWFSFGSLRGLRSSKFFLDGGHI